MGLFDAIGSALGIKTKKNNSTGGGGIAGAIGGSSNKPVATDHTHDSASKNQARTDALAARNNSGSTNVGSLSGFMGKNKDISGMQFGEMNRAGNMIENPPIQTAGASPSSLKSSPSGVPVDIDQQGVNSLYS